MWMLIYWIILTGPSGSGVAAATGQVRYATLSSCERTKAELVAQRVRAICVEND